jgi:hypothetical protein
MLSISLTAFLIASVSIGPHCIHPSHKFFLRALRLFLVVELELAAKYNRYSCPHMHCLRYRREASALVEPSLSELGQQSRSVHNGQKTRSYLAPALCVVYHREVTLAVQ